ncbi:MAG: hypothetical protein MRJ65_07470 [Candidatus Brocadiaceae bacterium]|nr:hypothetical protein [Candidatus Brocadiaceae bacterium]
MDNNKEQQEQVERQIREMIHNYAARSPYELQPDTKILDRVVKGLVMRKIKFGHAYCPCRLVSGNDEKDKKIICPCVYHVKEIERDGECHCNLFVGADYTLKKIKEDTHV